MPCSDGQMAALRVSAKITIAGQTIPTTVSHTPISVSARMPMIARAMPAEVTMAQPSGMYS